MSKRLLTMLAGVAALAMLVAGCGGGSGDDEEAAAPPLTKAQFVKQANAICKKRNEDTAVKYEAFYKAHQKAEPSDAEAEAMAMRVYFPNQEARLEALRELGPPKGDEGKVAAILKALEGGIKQAQAEGAEPFQSAEGAYLRANSLIQKYGLSFCVTF